MLKHNHNRNTQTQQSNLQAKFLLEILFISKIKWLATKHKNQQAKFRQAHSPPTQSFPIEKRCICSELSPSISLPANSHCISRYSLQLTEQSNIGPCCKSSHWLPRAADFLVFHSPLNPINSISSPSSNATPAHSPAHKSAPQTSVLSSSLHLPILMLHDHWSLYFFSLLALEEAPGLLPLPLLTSVPLASSTNVLP